MRTLRSIVPVLAIIIALSPPATAQSDDIAAALEALGADAEKGEKVFRKCKACHQVGPDAKKRVGPILNGIVGAAAGAFEEFKYSKAMAAAAEAGLVWSIEELDAFLTKPREHTPGTKMTFAGLRKDSDRANIIAYLAGFE